MQIHKGFIAIDGPNGAGKSTLIGLLKFELQHSMQTVVFTKEPTNSKLGEFIRSNQHIYHGKELGALVAADRYHHIGNLILPELEKGKIVITDRYMASSLVYQQMDGLSTAFILALNSEIILPSTYFILKVSETTLQKRLSERSELTRFESFENTIQEGALYDNAGSILDKLGVKVIYINNDIVTAEENAVMIIKEILS